MDVNFLLSTAFIRSYIKLIEGFKDQQCILSNFMP